MADANGKVFLISAGRSYYGTNVDPLTGNFEHCTGAAHPKCLSDYESEFFMIESLERIQDKKIYPFVRNICVRCYKPLYISLLKE